MTRSSSPGSLPAEGEVAALTDAMRRLDVEFSWSDLADRGLRDPGQSDGRR
jgi:hypothetical protein